MDELAVKYLKTYQVWHHRRLLLMITRKPGPELWFVEASLKADAKNYHTWSYRQWLLAYFNDEDLWSGELDFVDTMLVQDIRNNSAWHHRFFVVFQSGLREGEEDRTRVVKRELMYVLFQ
jgi:protein farnesyltransferase/geranylgeranyltransferase type-1 subunit alpha